MVALCVSGILRVLLYFRESRLPVGNASGTGTHTAVLTSAFPEAETCLTQLQQPLQDHLTDHRTDHIPQA